MQKHYLQTHPLRQSNNFVIFPDFFKHVNQFLIPRRSLLRNVDQAQTKSFVNNNSYSGSKIAQGNSVLVFIEFQMLHVDHEISASIQNVQNVEIPKISDSLPYVHEHLETSPPG